MAYTLFPLGEPMDHPFLGARYNVLLHYCPSKDGFLLSTKSFTARRFATNCGYMYFFDFFRAHIRRLRFKTFCKAHEL